MHAEALQWLKAEVDALGWADRVPAVLDLGSREAGEGRVRDLFPLHVLYYGLDSQRGPGVDWVADIQDLSTWPTNSMPMGSFDIVVCAEVLEHATMPGVILAHARLALRKGGVLLVTAAGPGREPHSCITPGPPLPQEWYQNVDPHDLALALQDFSFVRMSQNTAHHDVYALAVK